MLNKDGNLIVKKDDKEYALSEVVVRLSGSANIEQLLTHGDSLTIGLGVDVADMGLTDNHDGTHKQKYSLKANSGILIQENWGNKPIKAKSKKSPSQRLYNALFYKHAERTIEQDFQEWYDKKISEIIAKLDDII